ncbi:DUF302 domain-containing protein [Gillisia sp. JM1]|uniref:DUF302 domain-containing protein n=1 Tax=Gillisia sp. JM1 TaxID=1283286 RepID=UPI00041C6E76|nr:DUF302 domain-containing protein [Gillisia sp. JM1]
MIKTISFFSLLLILNSCKNDDPGDVLLSSEEININGTKYSESKNNFANTYSVFIDSLKANEAITIVAEVDHAANARSVGRVLNPTKIVFFGNPVLGTPLMQKNQLAGLDLPQKVLFFENSATTVYALYNSVPYLESRHDLQGVSTLSQISTALENLTKAATSSEIKRATDLTVEFEEGIITVESAQDFESTYNALENAIASNENLSIVVQLDHQANAASVGLELRPTKIIVFGNPNLGSPLMQNKQTIGLDLPQKMLVWEDENAVVKISYNDPFFLAIRYNIEGNEDILDQISTALTNLANSAAGL